MLLFVWVTQLFGVDDFFKSSCCKESLLQKVSDVTGFLCKGSSVYKVSGRRRSLASKFSDVKMFRVQIFL